MNREQNIKFLTGLGISKERAEAMSKTIPTDAAATPETEVDEAYQSAVNHQNELYKNGDDYKNALKEKHQQAMREVTQKSEAKIIKIAGLTEAEIKDKKFDEIVELAFKKASKMSDKTSDELQEELRKKDEELTNLRDVEIPKIKGEVETQKEEFKIRSASLQHIGKLALLEGVDNEDALLLFDARLKREGYKRSTDDKGNLVITLEDGGKIMTEDKKNMLTTEDVFKKLLDPQLKKSNAPNEDEKNKKKAVIDTKKDDEETPKHGTVVSANLNKAEKHAELLASKK